MLDDSGFRLNVGIILVGPKQSLFLAKRIGYDAWQFPQGGIQEGEEPKDALFRELEEEIGLTAEDVEILAESKKWLSYRLPAKLIRHDTEPVCVGQKQKWFVLKLLSPESKIRLDLGEKPEFDSWRWVDYWFPLEVVITFKRDVYHHVLREFSSLILPSQRKNKRGPIK